MVIQEVTRGLELGLAVRVQVQVPVLLQEQEQVPVLPQLEPVWEVALPAILHWIFHSQYCRLLWFRFPSILPFSFPLPFCFLRRRRSYRQLLFQLLLVLPPPVSRHCRCSRLLLLLPWREVLQTEQDNFKERKQWYCEK